jgi:hypothetical protein
LGAGDEGEITLTDLELKNSFSPGKCASHSIVMKDFMMEELAQREPGTSFIHSFPGIVPTPIMRELPLWARVSVKLLSPLIKVFSVSVEETGERQLFIATSGKYPPLKPADDAPTASGAKLSSGETVSKGSNGQIGNGGYVINWNGEPTGKEALLNGYRAQGVAKTVWKHTMDMFEKVEKINEEQAKVAK